MSTDDVDDGLPGPPNDGAYETDELRTGPPLSYVAEKFRYCLEGLHGAIGKIETAGKAEADLDELIGFQAKYAFHSAVVGYLALHNMLALANEHDISERLLRYSKDDFTEGPARLRRAGWVRPQPFAAPGSNCRVSYGPNSSFATGSMSKASIAPSQFRSPRPQPRRSFTTRASPARRPPDGQRITVNPPGSTPDEVSGFVTRTSHTRSPCGPPPGAVIVASIPDSSSSTHT